MKYIRNRAVALIVSLVLGFIAVTAAVPEKEAEAASKYIKVDAFVKYVVEQLRLPVDKYSKTPYIDSAMSAGLLKKGDFKSYSGYLTRTDCAAIANRIDKYLYGEYFGYTKEAYELLKDCNYVNGILYYSVEGNLYPSEATRDTYTADQFLEEVVKPRLESFNMRNLDACYYVERDSNSEMVGLYIEIGTVSDFMVNPFNDEDYLIQAWQKIIDGERLFSVVYEKRISDLNKVTKSKRQDVAEAFAKGLFKGYSNGMYVQSRSIKGSNKVTAAGAKEVVAMAVNKDKRAKISPDGQLIRTTNLPKNADEYPYILACFPNDFYEMVFDFQRDKPYIDGTMDKSIYHYPNEVGGSFFTVNYSDCLFPSIKPYEYYDSIMRKVDQYIRNVFNVDYRTVDKTWMKNIQDTFVESDVPGIEIRLEKYLRTMKANHVIVESQLISLEPSTLYEYEGKYFVRAYVKYRIAADTFDVEDDYELLFGNKTKTYLVGIKNGEWMYGYYDIRIFAIHEYGNRQMEFGVSPVAGISDQPLKGSK